ncbi:MAG: hypothetical protein E7399_05320 [Ruminococcaceae bacterium]|nr:hypothetical protein [Oscillospiraceae bacterium]
MYKIKVSKDKFAHTFGGAGFHNNDATMYHIIEKEHFEQYICKCYREVSPGFMRTFAGFSDWTKEAMDEFAEYYEKMQKWTDTPMYLTPGMGKKHFSDEEILQYCADVAERLAYLYHEKNVKHIRYYCFSNELSCVMWGELLQNLPLFKKYHEGFYAEFQKRNLPIGLLATDASEYHHWSTVDWAIENMASISEDFCVHIYEREHDIYNTEFYDFFAEKCKEIVDKSIRCFGKRVILGEIGIQKNAGQITFNKGIVVDTNRYFEDKREEAYCGLMLTEMAFSAINSGVFALAYWSYVDHPDPYSCAYSSGEDEYAKKWGEAERFFSTTADSKYNKWGFLKWDDENKDYGPRAHYWCIALLTKFFKRNSKVLDIEIPDNMIRACGILNRDNSVTIGIVNRNKQETEITLHTDLFQKDVRVYEYDPGNVPYHPFGDMQDFTTVMNKETVTYLLKPESVTYFTTDYITKEQRIFADNVIVSDGFISWDEVEDRNHCYYRVYTSDDADFAPVQENQIASTVGTTLQTNAAKKYVTVISVDKSGNM